MTIEDFKSTLSRDDPPAAISENLKALWYDAKGDWQKAHEVVQDLPDQTASLIHAYLHRKEGDRDNARYWYARAKKQMSQLSLQEEWQEMVKELL